MGKLTPWSHTRRAVRAAAQARSADAAHTGHAARAAVAAAALAALALLACLGALVSWRWRMQRRLPSDTRVLSAQLPTPGNQGRAPPGRHGFRQALSLEYYRPCKHAHVGFMQVTRQPTASSGRAFNLRQSTHLHTEQSPAASGAVLVGSQTPDTCSKPLHPAKFDSVKVQSAQQAIPHGLLRRRGAEGVAGTQGQLCYCADGSPWLLGSGAHGKVCARHTALW